MKRQVVRGVGGLVFLSVAVLPVAVSAQAAPPAGKTAPAESGRSPDVSLPGDVSNPAPVTPPAPVAQPAEAPVASGGSDTSCFPACRSGYLCHQGQCVSACNPPCAGNEVCSQSECVSKCNPGCRSGYVCSEYGECMRPERASSEPERASLSSEPPTDDERADTVPQGFVGVDMTFHTQSALQDISVVAPVFRGVFPVRHWTLEAELPTMFYDISGYSQNVAGYYRVEVPGDSGLMLGNPVFMAKHHWLHDGTDFYFGPGLALPVVQPSDSDRLKVEALGVAAGTRGAWNIWWYMPRALTLFAPIGVRHVAPNGLDVGAEAALAAFFHVGSGSRDTVAGAQLGGHLGYASRSVEAGAKLRIVRTPGDEGSDHGQVSFEPYLRGLAGKAYFGGGLLVNLDEPFGPLFDTGRVWGLRFEAGARL